MIEKELIIGHHIFLTKEQRYILQNINSKITVLGASLPIWHKGNKTNEPIEEYFCKYQIINKRNQECIICNQKGYEIYIPEGGLCMNLLDPKDGGCKFLFFQATIKQNDLNTVHQVTISDIDDLIASFLQ